MHTHPLALEKQTNIPPIDPCRSVCRTDGLNVLTQTKGLELQPAMMRPASRQTDYNKKFTCCVLMCDNPPVDTDLEKSQSSLM